MEVTEESSNNAITDSSLSFYEPTGSREINISHKKTRSDVDLINQNYWFRGMNPRGSDQTI